MQNQTNDTICRLCLNTKSDHFEELMGIKRYMLEFIVADINFDISTDPKICRSCLQKVQTSYEFKSACLENSVTTEGMANLELLNKILNPSLATEFVLKKEVFKKCCFCHSRMDTFDPDSRKYDDTVLKTMLDKCLPELDNKSYVAPCENCLEALEGFSTFFNYCLDTEAKIRNYGKMNRLSGQKQIDLYEVSKCFQYLAPNNASTSTKRALRKKTSRSKIAKSTSCKSAVERNNRYINRVDINVEINIKLEIDDAVDRDEEFANFSDDSEFIDEFKFANKDDDKSVEHCQDNNFIVKTEEIDVEEEELVESKYMDATEYTSPRPADETQSNEDHPEKKTYSCDLCSYKTPRKYFLIKHKRHTHKKVYIYNCDICSYATEKGHYLNSHMNTHNDSSSLPALKCELCSFETHRKAYLLKHMGSVHRNPADIVMHECEWCEYKAKHKWDLKRHEQRHGKHGGNKKKR